MSLSEDDDTKSFLPFYGVTIPEDRQNGEKTIIVINFATGTVFSQFLIVIKRNNVLFILVYTVMRVGFCFSLAIILALFN